MINIIYLLAFVFTKLTFRYKKLINTRQEKAFLKIIEWNRDK